MNNEIYKTHNSKHKLMMVVNDRMNIEESKNRILFQISKLNNSNEQIETVEFFMSILDAKYLCHMLINDLFDFESDSDFSLVRGKTGKVRSFNLVKKKHKNSRYYSVQIDNGSGQAKENGYTNFQKKEKGLFYSLSSEQAIKMSLALKDRIFQRELIFLTNNSF